MPKRNMAERNMAEKKQMRVFSAPHYFNIHIKSTLNMNGKVKMDKEKKDATVQVDTIREEMPPDLKKKLFPDDEPTDPAKVRQSASTASKKEGYGKP